MYCVSYKCIGHVPWIMDILCVLVIHCSTVSVISVLIMLCIGHVPWIYYVYLSYTVSVISVLVHVLVMCHGYTTCTCHKLCQLQVYWSCTMDILHVLVIYCVMYSGYNIVDILCVLVIYCVMYCVMIL